MSPQKPAYAWPAIYFIIEFDSPLDGFIRVPSDSLRSALGDIDES